MRLWLYAVRRAIVLVPVLLGVMTVTFALQNVIPVDQRCIGALGPPPLHGGGASVQAYTARCDRVLGLGKPVPLQWGIYMERTLTFQWGYVGNNSAASGTIPSIAGEPVATVLGWVLPYTLELAAISLALTLVLSFPLGRTAAQFRNRPVDQAARVMSFSGYAIPTYLLATLALIAFVLVLGHFALGGCSGAYQQVYGSWPDPTCIEGSSPSNVNYPVWLHFGIVSTPTGFPSVDAALHGDWALAGDTVLRMLLPAFIIAYGTVAGILRFVRNSMLEVMNLDWVVAVRAQGVPEPTVVRRHVGRASLNVTLSILGLTFVGFLGGFPIIEYIFGFLGVGRMLALSVQQPIDLGLLFGGTVLFALLTVVANLLVDISYAAFDPRVRYS